MREKGLSGEQVARDYLRSKGYRILESNIHSRYGELDIIAKDQQTVVFCEVKAFKVGAIVDPLSAITPSKQFKIRRTAEYYIHRKHLYDVDARFDVLCVENGVVSEHLINAF